MANTVTKSETLGTKETHGDAAAAIEKMHSAAAAKKTSKTMQPAVTAASAQPANLTIEEESAENVRGMTVGTEEDAAMTEADDGDDKTEGVETLSSVGSDAMNIKEIEEASKLIKMPSLATGRQPGCTLTTSLGGAPSGQKVNDPGQGVGTTLTQVKDFLKTVETKTWQQKTKAVTKTTAASLGALPSWPTDQASVTTPMSDPMITLAPEWHSRPGVDINDWCCLWWALQTYGTSQKR
jgi:hypothetical protein